MEITKWSRIDEPWLKRTIEAFLRSNVDRGGDLLPTATNVAALLKLGMDGAASGEPCLVGVVDGTPVAWLLWRGLPSPLDSRWKTIHALGSFTEPGHRSKGVADALRQRGIAMARELGYERIIGPVSRSNTRGERVFAEMGAWPTHSQWELLI